MAARWDRARLLCPAGEYTSQDWRDHHADHPDDLMQILGDVFRVYKSEERKRNGNGNPQGGRRKAQIDGSLDELWHIMTPRFSMDPFPQAYAELAGERSLRAYAMKAGMTPQDLSKKLKGKIPLYRDDLEKLAKAGDVHPAFFVEWRLMVIQELISHIVQTSPHLSIAILRGLSR